MTFAPVTPQEGTPTAMHHLIAFIAAGHARTGHGPLGLHAYMTPLEGEVVVAVLIVLAIAAVIGTIARAVSRNTGI